MSGRLPRTTRDVVLTVLDVANVVLLAGAAVAAALLGELLLVALAVAIAAMSFCVRRVSKLAAELGDRALDVAQLRRELDSCETELAQALDELARRDITEGGER